MDDLNKNQLILLALLVSFVTSIATGIATVSLLEQAPKEVTRVINRVVERTVETVTPETNFVTEETIIVKEEDLIIESIAANETRIARIFNTQGDFLALGVVVDRENGIIMTTPFGAQENVSVGIGGGDSLSAESMESGDVRVGLIRIAGDFSGQTLDATVFAAAGDLKLGQSIIAFSGVSQTTVALGVVSQLQIEESEAEGPSVVSLTTSVSSGELLPGSVITNLFGETAALFDGQNYIPLTVLKTALAVLET